MNIYILYILYYKGFSNKKVWLDHLNLFKGSIFPMEHVWSVHILGAAAWKERSVSVARDLTLKRTQKGKETNKQKANVTKIEEYISA